MGMLRVVGDDIALMWGTLGHTSRCTSTNTLHFKEKGTHGKQKVDLSHGFKIHPYICVAFHKHAEDIKKNVEAKG